MIFILLINYLALNVLAEDSPAVTVSLYYESLCPFSRQFVLKQLYPSYNELNSIMNVELIPYGNAHYKIINGSAGQEIIFTCQHGPNECLGNIIQSCALASVGSEPALELVNCMFASNDWLDPSISGPECAKTLKLDWNSIDYCSSSASGSRDELSMAYKTEKLDPPLSSVPWIVVNGRHTNDIEAKALNNLLKLVCDTYTGTKPKECSK